MIKTDGDRAKKRLWFAKKKLAAIEANDVPASTVIYDGFKIHVSQVSEPHGGWIASPMGAVVAVSNDTGVHLAVADFWAGGFTYLSDLHTLYVDPVGDQEVVVLDNPEDVTGKQTVKFQRLFVKSPFNFNLGLPSPDIIYVENHACQPGIIPYYSAEAFWLVVSDRNLIDFNEDGSADFWYSTVEAALTGYAANGSNVSGRKSITYGTQKTGDQPWRVIHQIDADTLVEHHVTYYETSSSKVVCAITFKFPTYTPMYLEDVIPSTGIPSGLRSVVLGTGPNNTTWPLGSYAFKLGESFTFLHGVNCTNKIPQRLPSDTQDYFDANPGDDSFHLFYCMVVDGAKYIIDSSQFLSLLVAKSTDEIIDPDDGSVQWRVALRMISQFFARPNSYFVNPYDSVMFHAHDGNVYTWTRRYGAVKFTITGLFTATLVIPDEVMNEDGVRPDITYAGLINETHTYICVCNKEKDGIRKVYVGSPFTSWSALPDVAEGYELVHVRPVSANPVTLLGIAKYTDEESVERYRLCFFREEWYTLGVIPVAPSDDDNFAVGLFGNDPLVADLAAYPSQPFILPQMPVGPYETYEMNQP